MDAGASPLQEDQSIAAGNAPLPISQCANDPTHELTVRLHLPLVREVALVIARRAPTHVELEELVSWGMEGLLDAARRYRAGSGAAFRTYARFRIRGAILDALRRRDQLSRNGRRKASILERTRRTLETALGRLPSETEVAEALEVDVRALRALVVESAFGTVSLEDLAPRGGASEDTEHLVADRDADPLLAVLLAERARLVRAAVGRLPEREHATVSLYYRSDLTMREVGRALGLTESRVSQLHAQALAHLRLLLHPGLAAA